MVHIKHIQGITLLDYPNKVASTLFTAGCNFRCPFCHNTELIENDPNMPDIPYEEVFARLNERKTFIDGICITGGEPLLTRDMIDFLKQLKDNVGLPIKIDTNGYTPEILNDIINQNLVNYIAMDIKTSFEKYHIATGLNINTDKIKESIDIIMNSNIDYEFRTTVVPEIVDSDDIRNIGSYIVGAKKFALQQFRRMKTYDEKYQELYPYKPEELRKFEDILKQFLNNIEIRGI